MKTVIEMAQESSDKDKVDAWHNGFWTLTQEELERFAELVRADEREACAQSLDKQADLACDAFDRKWAQEMAAAVRARGGNT